MDKFQDEVSYYTINGEVLDNRNRVLYDLTGIRIHMIDHVFDEKEVYDYVKGQIGKTREDIDEGKDLEAAARVISMQLLLGIDVKMKSAVQDIKDGVVSLPEEYVMTETCSSAFVLVTLETYVSPETQKIYEANPNATVTIDEYLGVKRSVTQHLEDFEKRDYYLGTAYYSGFLTTGPDSCLVPKGESNYNGTTNGMNCTGFVARVLKNLGADITKITTRRDGHYANASNWNDFVDTYNIDLRTKKPMKL